MLSSAGTLNQIKFILQDLIQFSLVDEFNFPALKPRVGNIKHIGFGKQDISVSLENGKTYKEIYDALYASKIYTCKLLDGALIQLMYEFKNDQICRHRLAFFSSPYLEKFQNEPEYYDEDEIYADMLYKNIVAFPIRFDYNASIGNNATTYHPASHFTLGQYKNCRIPVASPLTPSQFFDFILRNFYNTAFNKYCSRIRFSALTFEDTITKEEQQWTYLKLIGADALKLENKDIPRS